MRRFQSVALEAVVVAVLGLLFALLGNAVSPRGLRLTRDYFPGQSRPAPIRPSNPGAQQSADQAQAVAASLQKLGLQAARSNEVAQLFSDPRYQQGLVIFIDARSDHAFQAGHIPGAWQLDHYHPEKFLPTVMPLCLTAEQIIVYCTGGDCEDSEFAAITLRDAGIPAQKLFVYTGGIKEWTNQMPFEVGERGSGTIHQAGK